MTTSLKDDVQTSKMRPSFRMEQADWIPERCAFGSKRPPLRAAAVVPRSRLRKLAYPAATFRQNPLKASLLQSHRNSIAYSRDLVKLLKFIASGTASCEFRIKSFKVN